MHKMPTGSQFVEAHMNLARALGDVAHSLKQATDAASALESLFDQQGLAYIYRAANTADEEDKTTAQRGAKYSFDMMKKHEGVGEHLKALLTLFKTIPVEVA